MTVCTHRGCTTCRRVVVGLIAQQLRAIPGPLRAQVCAEALELARTSSVPSAEAGIVEAQIG